MAKTTKGPEFLRFVGPVIETLREFGVRLETQALRDLSLARLSFSFVTGGSTSRSFRPTSVGFGLSYTLP